MKNRKIPLLAKELAKMLEGIGLGKGVVLPSSDKDCFYINHGDDDLQIVWNLDPDWGNIGFQIADGYGNDIYLGTSASEAYDAIVKQRHKKRKKFGDPTSDRAKDLWKRLNRIAKARGEFGFATLPEKEMKEVLEAALRNWH